MTADLVQTCLKNSIFFGICRRPRYLHLQATLVQNEWIYYPSKYLKTLGHPSQRKRQMIGKRISKTTDFVKPADSARRAGQRRKMEESASHHVNNNKISFFLPSERAQGLTESFSYAFRPGLKIFRKLNIFWEFVAGLGKCICKQPGFRMNEYNIRRNVLKSPGHHPQRRHRFEKEFPKL